MKKFWRSLATIILVAAITGVCIWSYVYFTTEMEKVKESSVNNEMANEVNNEEEEISKEPIFTLENYPKVDASSATQPLTDAFIKNFTGEEEIPEDYFNYTKTHQAYLKLIEGKADLIVVTEPSEDELEYAKENNVELDVVPVVREGFVFYVNNNNKVKNLTLEQIQDIYTGDITNWSELGGNDKKIEAYQRPENSGSQTGMLSLVMKDKKIMEPVKENLIGTMEAIINLVADYDNGENSIGYSYYYYATTMFETINKEVANRIKLLAVDGVEPNNQTIKSGEYPLNTSYYVVIRKDEEENSPARKLRDAMLSKRGQAVAEEAGYVGVK